MCVDSTLQQIQGIMKYFDKYRVEGFASSLTIAEGLATELNIESSFPIKRRITRKRQFDEPDNHYDEAILEIEKDFEVNFFLAMVDTVMGIYT